MADGLNARAFSELFELAEESVSVPSTVEIEGKNFTCEMMTADMKLVGTPMALLSSSSAHKTTSDLVESLQNTASSVKNAHTNASIRVHVFLDVLLTSIKALPTWKDRTILVERLRARAIWYASTLNNNNAPQQQQQQQQQHQRNTAGDSNSAALAIAALQLALIDLLHHDALHISKLEAAGFQLQSNQSQADGKKGRSHKRKTPESSSTSTSSSSSSSATMLPPDDVEVRPVEDDFDNYSYEFQRFEFCFLRTGNDMLPYRRRLPSTKDENEVVIVTTSMVGHQVSTSPDAFAESQGMNGWERICAEFGYSMCFYDAEKNGYCHYHQHMEFKSTHTETRQKLAALVAPYATDEAITFLFTQTRHFNLDTLSLATALKNLKGIPYIPSKYWPTLATLMIRLCVPKALYSLCCHILGQIETLALFTTRRYMSVCAAVIFLGLSLEDVHVHIDRYEQLSTVGLDLIHELIGELLPYIETLLPLQYRPQNALPYLRLLTSRSGFEREVGMFQSTREPPYTLHKRRKLNLMQELPFIGKLNSRITPADQLAAKNPTGFVWYKPLSCWIPDMLTNEGLPVPDGKMMEPYDMPTQVFSQRMMKKKTAKRFSHTTRIASPYHETPPTFV